MIVHHLHQRKAVSCFRRRGVAPGIDLSWAKIYFEPCPLSVSRRASRVGINCGRAAPDSPRLNHAPEQTPLRTAQAGPVGFIWSNSERIRSAERKGAISPCQLALFLDDATDLQTDAGPVAEVSAKAREHRPVMLAHPPQSLFVLADLPSAPPCAPGQAP